jgi:pyridoxine kinase
MNILSIQSRVAYGHVGNAAAVFALQRLGHEVWPVDTTSLSNHLGYPTWTGRLVAPAEIASIISGLAQLDVLGGCDAVLSGYLGDAGNAAVVLDAVGRIHAGNPAALYACDPVIGDRDGGLFVSAHVVGVFAEQLLPAADLAFPNAFELERLTGGRTDRLEAALDAADALRARMRPGALVLVTSLLRVDGRPGEIEVLAVRESEAWLIGSPRREHAPHGAGDCFAALFLGHYLKDRNVETALARAVGAIHAVIEATPPDATELALIAAQELLVANAPRFRPRRVRQA